MRKAILCAALCVVAMGLPHRASAGWWEDWANWWNSQNNTGSNTGGNNVPLDGGLSLLALAGAGYGAKKVAASRRK